MIINDSISISDLATIIPTTELEYSIYYEYTDKEISKEKKIAFNKIDNSLKFYAKENKGDIFELYIKLLEFVDGEYAEIFIDDVPFVIEANKDKFCELFPNLSIECKRRLNEFYKKYCKTKK